MGIDAKMVKELRDKTGLGMMDCKDALTQTDGDMEKAIEILRKKGMAVAEKRAGRETKQGIIEPYIHLGGKLGVLVELNCETDFVARNPEFKELARDLAMHIAAADPKYLDPESIPADVLAKEKSIYAEQAANEGKPEKVVEKIVEGKIRKFYETVCLVEQGFVKDPDVKIKDLLTDKVAKIGESIKVGKFVRMVLGD